MDQERIQNYQCLICLEICTKPVSCQRCQKMICAHHVRRMGNKCPHCRLEPYQFKEEKDVEIHLEMFKKIRKEKLKKEGTFKCLVSGCSFEGKYYSMLIHRKSRHFDQKIDEIIFPEQREMKMKREALKKLFFNHLKDAFEMYHDRAVQIYAKTKGKCEILALKKFLLHLDKCDHPGCRQIEVGEEFAYIGKEGPDHKVIESPCNVARFLKYKV